MKKDYCLFNKAWLKEIKGHPYLIYSILESNWKKQMTKEEGVLFIRLAKRTENLKRNGRRRGHV